MDTICKPRDFFVDVGAHVGTWTLRASRHVRFVAAFEPNPVAFAVLTKNIRRNRIRNVAIYNFALGALAGSATLKLSPSQSASSSLLPTVGYVPRQIINNIRVVRLDDVFPDWDGTCLIKIDTEGFEDKVLQGASEVIRRLHPSFLVEIHNPRNLISCRQFLKYLDYSVSEIAPPNHLQSYLYARPRQSNGVLEIG